MWLGDPSVCVHYLHVEVCGVCSGVTSDALWYAGHGVTAATAHLPGAQPLHCTVSVLLTGAAGA